eukprot:403349177
MTTARFQATVPNNQYFSIGFGKTMTNCDMVLWQAQQASSKVQDMYSRGRYQPDIDSKNNYVTNFTYNNTHTVFTSDRLLSTGDSLDYIIPYNNSMIMNFAYVSYTSNLVEHSNNAWGSFDMRLYYIPPVVTNQTNGTNGTNTTNPNSTTEFPQDGGSSGGLLDLRAEIMGYDILYLHGWLLWQAWGVLGFLQIASVRYMQIFYKFNHYLHMAIGTMITGFTIAMSILAFKYYDYRLRDNLHSKLGYAVLILSGIILLSGFFLYFMKYKLKWRTPYLKAIKFNHKVLGYGLIVISQISILLGVQAYNKRYERDDYDLGIGHIVLFFGLLLICEVIYRVQRKRLVEYAPVKVTMTNKEFKEHIKNGKQYVVLDDLVVDVDQFQFNHPGGTFLINHFIGQDISKYFYGAYQLENYTAKKTNHTHSAIAVHQINKLIVARLINEAPEFIGKIVAKDEVVRNQTFTYTFQMKFQVSQVQKYYEDLNMIGKHFLINEMFEPRVKRHYTICNVMESETYRQYILLIQHFKANKKNANYNSPMKIHNQFFDQTPSNELSLTIKQYQNGKLTQVIAKDKECNGQYHIKGPMGKGLDIQHSGTHIAFTAGTGILVFLDLVAHLIRKNLGLLNSQEDDQISLQNFKFILYASFHSKAEAIGFDLCKGLELISNQLGKQNFEYIVRFGKDEDGEGNCNISRWSLETVDSVLKEQGSFLSKLWVCGTPRMNEDFDRILEKLRKKFDLVKHMYEIL